MKLYNYNEDTVTVIINNRKYYRKLQRDEGNQLSFVKVNFKKYYTNQFDIID